MSYLPDICQRFEQAFPEVHAAHQDLARTCYQAGPLDARSAPACQARDRNWRAGRGRSSLARGRALAESVRPEELRQVGLLALTTIGFPLTVAGLGWIEEVIASQS